MLYIKDRMEQEIDKIFKYLYTKVVTIKKGTRIYHGTLSTLPNNYTSRKANWFATDPEQSALHVIKKMGIKYVPDIGDSIYEFYDLFENVSVDNIYPKLYVYEATKDIYLFNLGSSNDIKEFALMIGFKSFEKKTDFGEHNKFIAEYLCNLLEDNKHIVGWYRMQDQKEIVICNTQQFLSHVNTIYMRNDIFAFDWKQVQKYMKEYKKYEKIKEYYTNVIKTLILETETELIKFKNKNINDLFEENVDEYIEIPYDNDALHEVWTNIFRSHIKHKKPNINVYLMILEEYFGGSLFEYLRQPYQNILENLSKIKSKIDEAMSFILTAENKYTFFDKIIDEPISKGIKYIFDYIRPITNKIYFCRIVKKQNKYYCKERISNDEDVLCSFWTSNDEDLLKQIAKAFNYPYDKIKNTNPCTIH